MALPMTRWYLAKLCVVRVCRHFVPSCCSLGSDTLSHRAGGATAVVEPIDAPVAQCKNCYNLSVWRFLNPRTDTHIQRQILKIIAQSTRSMSCTIRSEINKPINVKWSAPRGAKHTHRHRTPPLWDEVSIRTSKNVGRNIIQSVFSSYSWHGTMEKPDIKYSIVILREAYCDILHSPGVDHPCDRDRLCFA